MRIFIITSCHRPLFRSFLDQEVGERYRIFGKVRVADVVDVRRRLGNSGSSLSQNFMMEDSGMSPFGKLVY